jgi:long-subunit acyl-CoA synthetase (AMP-forming)
VGVDRNLSLEEKLNVQVKQGRQLWGVELKIVDDEGKELPRYRLRTPLCVGSLMLISLFLFGHNITHSDGKAVGDLLVRGPWITKSYYREGKLNVCPDGWFATGDVAKLDPDGYMQITGSFPLLRC